MIAISCVTVSWVAIGDALRRTDEGFPRILWAYDNVVLIIAGAAGGTIPVV